jgi:hypothetical protein
VVGYTGSLYVVRGTYPAERVESVYFFNGVDVSGGPIRAAVTLPLLRVETTPAAEVPGVTPAAPFTSAGIGDPLVRVDVNLLNDRARGLQVALAGAVKVPVVGADTGRGTGEADYGIGGSAFATLDRTSVMADVLFWKYGDPEGIDFQDTLSYSVGVARAVGSGRYSALASIGGFSSGLGGATPPLALNVGILALVGRRQSLAVTASIGLNESSSDFSIGTSWRIAR